MIARLRVVMVRYCNVKSTSCLPTNPFIYDKLLDTRVSYCPHLTSGKNSVIIGENVSYVSFFFNWKLRGFSVLDSFVALRSLAWINTHPVSSNHPVGESRLRVRTTGCPLLQCNLHLDLIFCFDKNQLLRLWCGMTLLILCGGGVCFGQSCYTTSNGYCTFWHSIISKKLFSQRAVDW